MTEGISSREAVTGYRRAASGRGGRQAGAGRGRMAEGTRDLLRIGRTRPGTTARHLEETMRWLCRAHDAGGDGGVARMYDLRGAWGASYPETTGYIIPTFLEYARMIGDDRYHERAISMADWEISVQMPSGAVQGGTVADPPSPAVFNTGQVIFGWVAAFADTGYERFRDAFRRACAFLVGVQDRDGAWRRDLSRFCSAPVDSYAYNIRTAWAMMLAARADGDEALFAKAAANINAVLGWTWSNGWMERNCLTDPEQPLLHTVAYAQQGLLEAGVLAGRDDAVEAALEGARQLRKVFDRKGGLHGRYDHRWRPTVRWRCLTGEAQTAVVWFRAGAITGDEVWRQAARDLLAQLKQVHRIEGSDPTVGGIKGSYPVYGGYGKYEYLNWAAKFFADALMQEAGRAEAGIAG